MRELAKRAINDEKEKEKSNIAYVKGMMHYKNGEFGKALDEFEKSEGHESAYMNAMSNMKLGRKDEAHRALWHYQNHVENWKEGIPKEEALERVKRFKGLLG